MFPLTSSGEKLRFSGNKIRCFPQDQSLSVKCFTVNNILYLKKLLDSEDWLRAVSSRQCNTSSKGVECKLHLDHNLDHD